ncbi:aliphatic sulfonate ABC transporter substrate-binding protein [Gemmata sp. JC717]|uniref:aliphatic sulfonate ABC transporter substrate-binding protein n=1 Tax=Gemmata algarum TaxID=2975278 RepID=UPI0021BB052C|nr:aliphatic sulfonate ABC transporter substrate-binding protein [Gemmata algarum]MDY3555015.1 aliphatic sulfonate ABC transporter substrate-binding protein [Gemmata algarum]
MAKFTANSSPSPAPDPKPWVWHEAAPAPAVRRMGRLLLVALSAILVALPAGCGESGSAASGGALRVGYQKWGTYSLLKASGALEPKVREHGLSVEWVEFPAGPPLLEALNAGSLDLGHAGDSPPLFAQASGVPFVYIAASSPSPESSAIVVRSGSAIHGPRDLKGKRIGFVKGSSAHTMVVRVLEKNGLAISDVTPVYLAPADARAALEGGGIDAWSIWDPYLAAAEVGGRARRIADGRGYVAGREYYFAAKSFAEARPEVVRTFLTELARVKGWAKDRPGEVNRMLADQTGIAIGAIEKAEGRRNRYDTGPITDALVAEQQAIADRYVELGLLPHTIDVRAAVANVPFGGKE